MPQILQDLGERELVRSILPKYCSAVGDDCGVVQVGDIDLLITTDPVPQPAARLLGGDPDPYWMGWLLVVINASDLAAAGAEPLAFLAAIEAPAAMVTADFERFLKGVRDACQSQTLSYAGGNLREAKELAAVGTAVGKCPHGESLRRTGTGTGDLVVSIGQGGLFWRDALAIVRGGNVDNREVSPLFRPRSQIGVMQRLRAERMLHAAIDNSDGLLPSLAQLADMSSCNISLDLNRLTVPGIHEFPTLADVDVARLWLGWGDWNVVAAIGKAELPSAQKIVTDAGGVLVEIGKVAAPGPGKVSVTRDGVTQEAPRLESERFAKDSWFAGGIESYVKLLLEVPLP